MKLFMSVLFIAKGTSKSYTKMLASVVFNVNYYNLIKTANAKRASNYVLALLIVTLVVSALIKFAPSDCFLEVFIRRFIDIRWLFVK